jgi:CysZ protein
MFGFFSGITYPCRTLIFFKEKPRLLGYLIVPILLNILLGISLYAVSLIWGWQIIQFWLTSLSTWLDNLIANLPTWLSILEYLVVGLGWLLHFFLILGLFILTGFVFTQFGVLLGAPWYGKLSEQIEKIRTEQLLIVEVGLIGDIWRAIQFELKKLFLIIVIGLPLLLLNFIPGWGTLISTVGGITLTGTIVCLDFLDAPLERRRLPFREKLRIVFSSLPASAGFALACLGLISIPLLNLLTIPLCVASGTLFFCDRVLPKWEEYRYNRK